MNTDSSLMSLHVGMGVLFVDLLLSGDNAIVIAMVCRTLDKAHRVKALWLGILGALLARLVLTAITSLALHIPLLKLLGGCLLLKIAIDLIVDSVMKQGAENPDKDTSKHDVYAAARTIVLADIVMSLDNVLALSAMTQNNFQMLVYGLLLSIPILMFGSLYISKFLDLHPCLVWIGGGLLAAIAGSLIIEDPIFGDTFVNSWSIASTVVPVLVGIYALCQSSILIANRGALSTTVQPMSPWRILFPRRLVTVRPEPVPPLEQPKIIAVLFEEERPAPQVPSISVDSTPAVLDNYPIRSEEKPSPAKRFLMPLGIFSGLVALYGIVSWVMSTSIMPVPSGFKLYECKNPQMSINYVANAVEIRFTTSKGFMLTPVKEGRIIWDDYRSAGMALGIPPPTHILSVDTEKIVVNGGMFDHATCFVAAP